MTSTPSHPRLSAVNRTKGTLVIERHTRAGSGRVNSAVRHAAVEIWLPVVLVACWWAFSANSTSSFFPPLQKIVADTISLWFTQGHLATDLLPSLINLSIGYALAVVLGIAAGVVLGLLPALYRAVEPELEFLRAVPAVAILPVAIIAIGLGDDMRVAVIAFGALWPVLVNTIAGIRSTDPVVKDVSSAFRLTPWTRLFAVRLPSAAPQIFAGARTALSVAIVLIVVSEMSGAYRGIGNFLLTAQRNFAITDMWSAMVILGLLGYILNLLFRFVEAHALRWHPAYRKVTK
jgi:sulfonate transport system permease protein